MAADHHRRFERTRVRGRVTIHTKGGPVEGYTIDLSLGGALVKVTAAAGPLVAEPRARIDFELGPRLYEVAGRTQVRGTDALAIVFLDRSPELDEMIEAQILDGLRDETAVEPDATPSPVDYFPSAPIPVPSPEGPCVLVVDDDDDLREMVVGVLRAAGYCAEGAGDGSDALDMLRQAPERYSVILLDYRMPDIDGYQFRIAQQADPAIAGIPVVLTTGTPKHELPAIDPDAELRKPISATALLDVIGSFKQPN